MAAVDGLTSNQSILPALRMFNWQETMRTLSKLSVVSCLLLTQQPVGQNVVYVSLCLTSTICMTSVMISCFPSIHSSHEVSFLHSQPPKVSMGPSNISQDKYHRSSQNSFTAKLGYDLQFLLSSFQSSQP